MANENDKKSDTKKKAAAKKPSEARTSKKVESPAASDVKAAKSEAETSAPKEAKAKKAPVSRHPLHEKTLYAKTGQYSENWKLIDAEGQPLGRLSTVIASALMGKDKPAYTRFADTGSHVVVINAEKVVLTGNKWNDKTYHYHTNYPGGLKSFTAKKLLEKHPERIIERAVYGMLPKGHMGRRWFKKLRVFAGTEHPHLAQKPEKVNLPNFGSRERA